MQRKVVAIRQCHGDLIPPRIWYPVVPFHCWLGTPWSLSQHIWFWYPLEYITVYMVCHIEISCARSRVCTCALLEWFGTSSDMVPPVMVIWYPQDYTYTVKWCPFGDMVTPTPAPVCVHGAPKRRLYSYCPCTQTRVWGLHEQTMHVFGGSWLKRGSSWQCEYWLSLVIMGCVNAIIIATEIVLIECLQWNFMHLSRNSNKAMWCFQSKPLLTCRMKPFPSAFTVSYVFTFH